MNLVSAFLEQANDAPDRTAIIECGRRRDLSVSYAELDARSARIAGFLQSKGIAGGDVALVFAPMSVALYEALIGLWRIGAVALFVDPSGGRALLDRACKLARPRAFIGIGKAHLYRLVSREIRSIPLKIAIGATPFPASSWKRALAANPFSGYADVPADQSALLTFTSGSTAAPKAAARSHRLLLAQRDALLRSLALEAGEVDLATLPIFALANLACGLTTVIPDVDLRRPGFIDAERALACIRRHRTTRSSGSPRFFMRLCERCEETGESLPFRKVYIGGAPVFPRYLEAIARAAPGVRAQIVYGSTEAEPIAHVAHDELGESEFRRMREGSGLPAGAPTPETAVRIVEDRSGEPWPRADEGEFARHCLPAGRIGEIVVTGEHVLKGYLDGEGDAANKLRVGDAVWHRTGDAGYFDERGRLWLLGRCGGKVVGPEGAIYPFAVEAAASLDPRVAWAALVERDGRAALAVELAEGVETLDPATLALPPGLVEELVVIGRMPLDGRHNAKIDYPKLRKLLKGERGFSFKKESKL